MQCQYKEEVCLERMVGGSVGGNGAHEEAEEAARRKREKMKSYKGV